MEACPPQPMDDIVEPGEDRLLAALRTSESRYRRLFETARDGILLLNADTAQIEEVNPYLISLLGYSHAEFLGKKLWQVGPFADIAECKDMFSILQADRYVRYEHLPLKTITGSRVHVEFVSNVYECEGVQVIQCNIRDITQRKAAEDEIARHVEKIKLALKSTVTVATTISELRDPYTAGHERRVGDIAVAIGAELGLKADQQEGLQVAGHLHDIGKINIPLEILSKPAKLRATEYQLVQEHARAGYDVLKGVEFSWPVAQVALQHHERMDGSGYPQGLKGNNILIEARVIAVADVVEAMISHRPYRAGLSLDVALAEIERGRGTVYDVDATDACLRIFRESRYRFPD